MFLRKPFDQRELVSAHRVRVTTLVGHLHRWMDCVDLASSPSLNQLSRNPSLGESVLRAFEPLWLGSAPVERGDPDLAVKPAAMEPWSPGLLPLGTRSY